MLFFRLGVSRWFWEGGRAYDPASLYENIRRETDLHDHV